MKHKEDKRMKTIDRNRTKYEAEKESRDKRLKAYADAIQNMVQNSTTEVVKELVIERKRQGMTQQELASPARWVIPTAQAIPSLGLPCPSSARRSWTP